MLKRFGEYLLESRQRAALIAFLFSFIPLMGWISSIIIGLVTLRKGPLKGLWIVLWASVVDIVAIYFGYYDAFIFGIVGGSVFIWLMASLLWLTASWVLVLEIAMLLGVVAVLFVHGFMPDVADWWLHKYQALINKPYTDIQWLAESSGYSNQQEWSSFVKLISESQALQFMAKMMTGGLIAFVIIMRVVKVVLARWWQSIIFNPGGLRKELYNLKLGYTAVAGLIMVLFAALAGVDIAWDILPILIVGFLLAGLSLTHALVFFWKNNVVWLFVVYIMLILFTPYCVALLILLAVIDSIFDIRHYFNRQQEIL